MLDTPVEDIDPRAERRREATARFVQDVNLLLDRRTDLQLSLIHI